MIDDGFKQSERAQKEGGMVDNSLRRRLEREPNGDLLGAYHRFGEIGPVYEVVGIEDDEFVTICLVESGDTARYPASEVRADPLA